MYLIQVTKQDTKVELETYKQTRQGLDEMYSDVWKQLKEEKRVRMELEKELELQIGMKTEMEIAMKLLEKDTHEKQDTLVALRQQLEEVKAINLQMFHKAQVEISFIIEVNISRYCTVTQTSLFVRHPFSLLFARYVKVTSFVFSLVCSLLLQILIVQHQSHKIFIKQTLVSKFFHFNPS